MNTLQEITDGLYRSVKGYVARSIDALDARLKAVEARQPIKGDKGDAGDKGEAGKDADPQVIRAEVEKAVSAIPKPKDGESVPLEVVQALVSAEALKAVAALNLKNGKDADEFAIYERVMQSVQRALDAIPAPKDGKDGTSVDFDAVVDAVVKRVPTPKDGRDGTNGTNGEPGINGKDAPPVDVQKLADDVLARVRVPSDGKDAPPVDVEKIALDVLSRIPPPRDGRDGTNGIGIKGERGEDGFGFDDMEFEHDGERTAMLRFVRGDRVKEFKFHIPALLDRGVYKPAGAYEKGDGVTYGGSFWFATSDAPKNAPGAGNPEWRLAVKRGQDAK
jgi:hypothetical protein